MTCVCVCAQDNRDISDTPAICWFFLSGACFKALRPPKENQFVPIRKQPVFNDGQQGAVALMQRRFALETKTTAEVMWCWMFVTSKMPDFHIRNCRLCLVSDDYDHLKRCLVSWAEKKKRAGLMVLVCFVCVKTFAISQEMSMKCPEHLKNTTPTVGRCREDVLEYFYEKKIALVEKCRPSLPASYGYTTTPHCYRHEMEHKNIWYLYQLHYDHRDWCL